MQARTLDEWIARYDAKTPEPFKRDERFNLYYVPERGFCEIGMNEKMVFINQLAGDALWWKEKVSTMARGAGLTMGGTRCVRRSVLAYIRLLGYEVVRTEDAGDGLKRYYGVHKQTHKKGLASPSGVFPDGTRSYFMTWEV